MLSLIHIYRVDRATYVETAGGTSLRDSRSLSQVFQALDDPRFQYIERGCFVNLDHVAGTVSYTHLSAMKRTREASCWV